VGGPFGVYMVNNTGRVYEFELQSVVDLFVQNQEGTWFVYEGKNTQYPDKASPNQVWWQLNCIDRNKYPKPSTLHFMVFYRTAEIRPFTAFKELGEFGFDYSAEVHSWINRSRNPYLLSLMRGDFKPTPSSSGCRHCTYQYICPDKWQPPKDPSLISDGPIRTTLL
jgi:hypothetical protein